MRDSAILLEHHFSNLADSQDISGMSPGGRNHDNHSPCFTVSPVQELTVFTQCLRVPWVGLMKIAMCRALPTKMLVGKLVKTSLVLGKSFENILSTMYEVLVISGQVYSHPRA